METVIDIVADVEPSAPAKPLFAVDDFSWVKEYENATGKKIPQTCSPWLKNFEIDNVNGSEQI